MEHPTIEELTNKITLMKQALMFYANKENYLSGGLIEQDRGEQAIFVINQIKEIDKYIEELNEQAKNTLNEFNDVNSMESLKEQINKLKEINKNL
ncbi:MAG: hypothetical protein ACOCVF_01670 [bacterium]